MAEEPHLCSTDQGNAKPALYELLSSSSPGSAPKLQYIRATNSSRPCLQKELSAGVASFPAVKDLYASKNSIAARQVGGGKTEMVVPNIGEDSAPAIMAANCLTAKRSASMTSAEELCVPEAQPNRRRSVKRLKLNTRDSLAQGTRGEGGSSGRNVDLLFAITSKDLCKNQKESDTSLVVLKKLDFSSMESMKRHEDLTLTLSHPWIRRLRHRKPDAQSMKAAARVEAASKLCSYGIDGKGFGSYPAM